MPEYGYEALDASGKSFAGTISCRDEQQALEALDKSGLHPTKLTLREETPPTPAASPIVRIVAGLIAVVLAKWDVILETALIFLLLAFFGGSLAGWPGVSCAAAITIFNFRAQHLSKKAARTTAESLGRSLGRSLGWLLFGHPIVFWSLLIGAAIAIIYSVT